MLRPVFQILLVFSLLITAFSFELQFSHCNCDGDSSWSSEKILQWQKVSDFMIAAAYFSIPLELLYFVTSSGIFPFKWILFQFGAFIILCGLTHLLAVFTYEPHSFTLMLSLTISKFLTALVSFATALTLLTLIPQLLRVMVRENFLRIKAHELDRRVGILKRQEEASCHVRMLTQVIRKSLDRHTILYTTLVELSNTLKLQNCVVWMPNEARTAMTLTHELRRSNSMEMHGFSIPIDDVDVMEIYRAEGAVMLRLESVLGSISSGGMDESGAVAAIRMPMLKVANFKWGTPKVVQASYAILVLVLPKDDSRVWTSQELQTVKVVADQVAVALSHAAVLEESQMMRDKLEERKRALIQAKQYAMMASEARNAFQRVMSQGMRRPIHSIVGLLSMLQQENLGLVQRLVVDSMMKTSGVVATLINDVMEISTTSRGSFSLEMRPFSLHTMIKEASTVTRCLCDCKAGFGFGIQVENSVPDVVIGDETRIFHVILHIFGNLLNGFREGIVTFRVLTGNEMEDKKEPKWIQWKSNFYTCVKFEIEIKRRQLHVSDSFVQPDRRPNGEGFDMGLSFSMCEKLVQMMQGSIWVVPNSQGITGSIMALALNFQLQPPNSISQLGRHPDQHRPMHSASPLKGLRVLVVDDDEINRAVTRILLEKLGCHVTSVSSGSTCLNSLSIPTDIPFQLVTLDLHMPEMNGFEVAMRIQKLRSECCPLIVGLTESGEKDMLERCRRAGMHGLIWKPVMLQALRDELFRVLQNS